MAFNRENTTQLALYVPIEIAEELADIAYHTKRHRTDIIREAIYMWLESNSKKEIRSNTLSP